MPKKVKYRKQQRGRRKGKAGAEGTVLRRVRLKALEPAWITDRQIEASRVAITRFIKRGGKLWIGFFRTSRSPRSRRKPAWVRERRAGKWVAVVKPGRVMFEMAGVDLATAKER